MKFLPPCFIYIPSSVQLSSWERLGNIWVVFWCFVKSFLNKIKFNCPKQMSNLFHTHCISKYSNDCSYKWSLYRVIRWKLIFHGKGMTLLIAEDVNLLIGIFLLGEMSKFLAVEWYSPPFSGFPIKVHKDNGV